MPWCCLALYVINFLLMVYVLFGATQKLCLFLCELQLLLLRLSRFLCVWVYVCRVLAFVTRRFRSDMEKKKKSMLVVSCLSIFWMSEFSSDRSTKHRNEFAMCVQCFFPLWLAPPNPPFFDSCFFCAYSSNDTQGKRAKLMWTPNSDGFALACIYCKSKRLVHVQTRHKLYM